MNAISKDLKCSPKDIIDFELNVIDTQPGTLGGFHKEFLITGR